MHGLKTAEEWDKIAHKRRWEAFWTHQDITAACEVSKAVYLDIQCNALEAAAKLCESPNCMCAWLIRNKLIPENPAPGQETDCTVRQRQVRTE